MIYISSASLETCTSAYLSDSLVGFPAFKPASLGLIYAFAVHTTTTPTLIRLHEKPTPRRSTIMSMRILITDDHPAVCAGIRSMLHLSGLEIIGSASSGQMALDMVEKEHPSVVLLDVKMPGFDGIETLQILREQYPATMVVMLSTYDSPTYIARSITHGAYDYLLKSASRLDLLACLSRVEQRVKPADTSLFSIYKRLMARRRDKGITPFGLTNREVQTLRHLGLGLSNREVAISLGISIETVKEHVQSILRKTNATDRTQIAVWAVKE